MSPLGRWLVASRGKGGDVGGKVGGRREWGTNATRIRGKKEKF